MKGFTAIHTEVVAYGHRFTFGFEQGTTHNEVDSHWLYKNTNGEFGILDPDKDQLGNGFKIIIFLNATIVS